MIIFQQSNGQLETVETRIAHFNQAIDLWLEEGFAYVTLSARGTANPHRAGVLAQLLALVARSPGGQLVELAAPDARQRILKWALTPRPTETKGTN
jgi:hypothetical protein